MIIKKRFKFKCEKAVVNMNDIDKNKYIGFMIDEALRELECQGILSRSIKEFLKKNILRRSVSKEDMIRWPQGMLLLGLSCAGETDTVCDYFDKWIESGAEVTSLEDVLAGQVMLKTVLGKSNKAYFYMKYCDKIASFLSSYKRDEEGSLPYNVKALNEHIYADSIGMVCPFLMMYGFYTGEQKYADMALLQIENFMKNAMDEGTWLPYHGYRYKEHEKYGIIGWGRATGWLMMGMSGCLNTVRAFASEVQNDSARSEERTELVTKRGLILSNIKEHIKDLKEYYDRLSDTVIRYQRADGLWGWNLEDDESQTDTSASAMILYAFSQFAPNSIVKEMTTACDANINTDSQDIQSMKRGIAGVSRYITSSGKVMQCQAECGGFGIYPEKFGSYPWSVGMTLAFMAEIKEL